MTLKDMRKFVAGYPEGCDDIPILVYYEPDIIEAGVWAELEVDYLMVGVAE